MTHIHINGQKHPVSPKFMEETGAPHADLLGVDYATLTAERDGLLRLSEQRHSFQSPPPNKPMAPGGTLTQVEYDRLQAITRTINVHHAVNFLQGRSHEEFGFEGVDHVHGNAVHLPCGCVLHHIFDHHRRHEEEREVHPHYPRHRCPEHAGVGDFKTHYHAVLAAHRDEPK